VPTPKPARLRILMVPPTARLEATPATVRVTGEGDLRLVDVDAPDGREPVTLVASLPGYVAARQTWVPTPGEDGDRTLTLEPEPAVVTLRVAPRDARVVVRGAAARVSGDGAERKVTIPNPDPARPVTVAVSRDGYDAAEKQVTPKPGSQETLTVSLVATRRTAAVAPAPAVSPRPPQPPPQPPAAKVAPVVSNPKAAPAFPKAWTARDLRATRQESIVVLFGRQPSSAGVILAVTGQFAPQPAAYPAAVKAADIGLVVRSKGQSKTVELLGVGIAGKDGRTSYLTPKTILTGGIALERDGMSVHVSKATEGAPADVTIVQANTSLCLAFDVPDDQFATYELRFAGLAAKVPVH
jgi:hypothetical protein